MATRGQRIGYKRVSTIIQKTDRQLEGIELDKIFEDKASGATVKRPQLEACLDWMRDGDTLYIHSIDRLARNTADLLNLVKQINGLGVVVKFVKENLTFDPDSKDHIGQMLLTMIGAIAEFEREMIRERREEGIIIARRKGKRFGRAKAIDKDELQEFLKDVVDGISKEKIAEKYGVSRATVYNTIKRNQSSIDKLTENFELKQQD